MAHLPRGMKHIDRDDLFTSLPTRVQYLQNFLNFGIDDLTALEQGQGVIKAAVPDIVESVYSKLLEYDITARVFSRRDSRNEDDPDVRAQNGSSAIQNRKIFLRWYLTKLNGDPTKPEYWDYLDQVGSMHIGHGRRNPLHVDYIFLGATLAHIQDAFTQSILSKQYLDLHLRIDVVRAVGKLIWIQNDLLARWHIDEGDGLAPKHGSMSRPVSGHGRNKESAHASVAERSDECLDDRSVKSTASHKTSLGRSIPSANSSGSMNSPQYPFSGVILDEQRATPPPARPRS